MLKSEKNENVLFQADIKAYENTWTNYRRKRRLEQRIANNKRQKMDNNEHNKSDNKRTEDSELNIQIEHAETATTNTKAIFSATLVLRKEGSIIWINMLHLDGSKDKSYQVFQFLKNRFI